MSDETAGDGTQQRASRGRTPEWERARRRAAVFGETLPETTADERDPGTTTPRDGDTWLKEQVPPHHGD